MDYYTTAELRAIRRAMRRQKEREERIELALGIAGAVLIFVCFCITGSIDAGLF